MREGRMDDWDYIGIQPSSFEVGLGIKRGSGREEKEGKIESEREREENKEKGKTGSAREREGTELQ